VDYLRAKTREQTRDRQMQVKVDRELRSRLNGQAGRATEPDSQT